MLPTVQVRPGLYELTWDVTAIVGFTNSGTFILSAEWYDGGGNFLDFAPDRSASYSATVASAAVPEPATLLLVASGIVALGAAWGKKILYDRDLDY